MTDALGSVRQLASRSGSSRYGYTGEQHGVIGNRQIVRQAVDTSIFLNCGDDTCLPNFHERNDPEKPFAQISIPIFCDQVWNLDKIDTVFNVSLFSELGYVNPWGLVTKMQQSLARTDWHSYSPSAPWEWGNPTLYTAATFTVPDFMAALKSDDSIIGYGDEQILFRDVQLPKEAKANASGYYDQVFVLTQGQQNHWCHGLSCVAKP